MNSVLKKGQRPSRLEVRFEGRLSSLNKMNKKKKMSTGF